LEIPLEASDGILTLRAGEANLTQEQMAGLDKHIDTINVKSDGRAFVKLEQCPSFILNEAKLTREQQARLEHWRLAHRTTKGDGLHENCPICAEGKRKTSSFKRNDKYRDEVTRKCGPYWRIYYDSYGGQNSMGAESYQGAVGGFVFVCPSSGTIKVKLYASTKQFPAILYQVLQEIETEGYACKEMYFDTFKVNFSAAAEEVAAMFKVRLVPVSAGSPEEVAYAESAVKTIAAMSRCLMAGAPHLPKCFWGLADIHAAQIVDVMPQESKGKISPYEHKKKREPSRCAFHQGVRVSVPVRAVGRSSAQTSKQNGMGILRRDTMAHGVNHETRRLESDIGIKKKGVVPRRKVCYLGFTVDEELNRGLHHA
jgi:hypothetical protein